jgi:hypothetical protein
MDHQGHERALQIAEYVARGHLPAYQCVLNGKHLIGPQAVAAESDEAEHNPDKDSEKEKPSQ